MISIIVTAYNYEKYVAECLESCLAQSYSEFEVILVDDGSTDQTLSIAQSYGGRVWVVANQNAGVESASNSGIRVSKGKYLVRVDADDRLEPNYLERMSAFTDPAYAFIYPEYKKIDSESCTLEEVQLPDFDPIEVKQRGDFLATGTLFSRSAIEEVGLYESTRNCGLENYELVLKLLRAGYQGRCVHESLFGYRIHGNNMSSTRRKQIIEYGSDLADRFELGQYQTNQYHPYGLRLEC